MSGGNEPVANGLPGAVSAAGGSAAAGGAVKVHAEGDGSIAAQWIGAAHHHEHVHLPARGPVSWPQMVGLIPPRAGAFQDRAERFRLREAATGGGTVVPCQVLTGMGGVGKTQLAADLAEEAWNDGHGVDLLVWVTASSRDAIVADFARAGEAVCGADAADPQEAAHGFLAWLRTGRRRWLVVLDDVADPGDVTGLWPPAVAHGRTVVTTRRRDAALAGGRRVVEVGVFTDTEATVYLTSVLGTGGRTEPPGDLAGLAEDLGRLPLALSQAAAYILDAGIPVGEYRDLLARRARSLAEISPDVRPDDQTHGMAAAWELSVDYADRLRPRGLARPMLELAAFLAPNGIPVPVLTSAPALAYLTSSRRASAAEDGEVTAKEASGALRALHRLNLVTASGPAQAAVDETGDAGHTVRAHQIVQRATRDSLAPAGFGNAVRAVADALESVWPDIERDTSLARALRACATALISCSREGGGHDACLQQPDAHPVLFRLGRSLGESGQVSAAVAYHGQLAATAERHLGPDHPHTLAARTNLAHWRGEAGDAAGAAEALAALLEDMVRVLGPEDPDTLVVRNNLAQRQGEAGDAARAAEAFAVLLEDRLRVLGADHPDTFVARNNLAFWRGRAGDAAGAAEAFAALLEDRLRVLGPDHPHTLTTRGHLAYLRGQAGDAAGAAEALAELLDDQVRVLGPDHPDTFTTRHNAASMRGEAGDAAGAAEAFAALLGDQVRVLGPDHPDILTARDGLARWRGEAGDPAGAAEALAALLEDMVRVLGPDDPDTLATRNNLAQRQGEAGDAAGAAEAFAVLLEDRLRVLGPYHAHTFTSRLNLAYWRGAAGDAAGAAEAFAALLGDQVRVLGPDHPHTLTTRGHLAYLRATAGDASGAAEAFRELLDDMLRVLGPDHPQTRTARGNLAYLRTRTAEDRT